MKSYETPELKYFNFRQDEAIMVLNTSEIQTTIPSKALQVFDLQA